MDLQTLTLPGATPAAAAGPLCPCACPFCCRPSSPSWRRSIKRRPDPEAASYSAAPLPATGDVAARVEVENEVAALRETVASQQQTIQDLCGELDEERNASASAASEAMSMILRLQREKAEAQMEARQFKRFAEEKMDHDQQELLFLEDLLFKRDEAVRSLTFQLQAYRHRLLSYGIDPDSVGAAPSGGANDEPQTPQFDELPTCDYPPLKCTLPNDVEQEEDYYDEAADPENCVFGESPHAKVDLQNLEQRICQLETSHAPSGLMEKGVVKESPRPSGHFRQSSGDSHCSVSDKREEFPASMDRPLDDGGALDDMSDRVYTIDSVHRVPKVGVSEGYVETPKEEKEKRGEMDGEPGGGSLGIKNLYMRLQALEADRESMRQALISMRTEKAQLVLFREIAQQLYKEVAPERRIVKKKSSTVNVSIVFLVKWIIAFIVWRKKASQTRYTFGSSNNNVGLMLLLDKTPRISNGRCVTRTHV